jgi:hypothetical protein
MIVWNNGILTTIPPNGDIPIIMTQDITTEAEMVIDIEMTDTDPDDLYRRNECDRNDHHVRLITQ